MHYNIKIFDNFYQILYSFVLYSTILLASNRIDKNEFLFFLSGGMALKTVTNNPAPDWLPDKSWNEIDRVNTLSGFEEFPKSFSNNLMKWKIYYDLLNPEKAPLPEPWENTLTPFQKLIVMRMIRPDKIIIAVSLYTYIFNKIFFFLLTGLCI